MKSFIIHQISDWEKLKQLIRILAQDNLFQSDFAHKQQIKFFVLISEVFQFQIIEYLPLIMGILFKKLEKEHHVDLLNIIAETVQLIFYHSFRKKEYETEYEDLLLDTLSRLFDMVAKPAQETQMGAAMTILRLIQLDNLSKFDIVYDMIVKNIFKELGSAKCRVIANILECLLFLNKAFPHKCSEQAVRVAEHMIGLTGHPSTKVRKISVDNLLLLIILHPEDISKVIFNYKQHLEVIAEAVLNLKADKDKNVRESSMNCINGLKTILGEQFFNRQSLNTKSVIEIKREEASRPSTKKKPAEQGKPRKVDEDPFKLESKPVDAPLFPKAERKTPEKKPKPSKPEKTRDTIHDSMPEKKPNQRKGSVPRKPIKEQKLNEAFRESMTEGVEIYVNYPYEENDHESAEESDLSDVDKEEGLQSADEPGKDLDLIEQVHPPTNEQKPDQSVTHKGKNSSGGKIEKNKNKSSILDEMEAKLDEGQTDPLEEDVFDEGEYRAEENMNQASTGDLKHPVTDTHRLEINEEELQYKPQSFRFAKQRQVQNLDYEEPELEEFARNEERLSRENYMLQQEYLHHQNVIEFQNKRIEGLMMQINNLTTNLNIVLNKAASLEQNVFHLNYQSQQGYMPHSMQSFVYPAYSPNPLMAKPYALGSMPDFFTGSMLSPRGHLPPDYLMRQQPGLGVDPRSFGTTTSLPTPREEIEMVRRQIAERTQEVAEWELKRREEELKLKEKMARINRIKKETLQPKFDPDSKKKPASKITGERTIEAGPKEEAPVREKTIPDLQLTKNGQQKKMLVSNKASKIYKNIAMEGEDSLEEPPLKEAKQSFIKKPVSGSLPQYLDQARYDEEKQAQDNKMQIRAAKMMNLTLSKILEESEYRRLLDFLADRENFKRLGMIDSSNLQLLVAKMTDMLSYKAETYIEECIPWITKLIALGHISDVSAANDLLYVVKMVLGADKKRKVYQNHTIKELQALAVEIEGLIATLKKSQLVQYY